MERSKFNDHFKLFPYRKDFKDGRTNNGGIDLVKEPQRINEITEAQDFPELKQFIVDMNAPDSPYMTLGCEGGYDSGIFHGYMEFSFRDPDIANNIQFISKIDKEFIAYVSSIDLASAEYLEKHFPWEYVPFSFHDGGERMMLAFYYTGVDQKAAGELLSLIAEFLLNHCPLL
jgi:hypothetical protein